jgi:pimeloyl-ACP methyl ester carboxylesterase
VRTDLSSPALLPPVVLLHGFGSSFEREWVRHGWTELLDDEGRQVLARDLPGHGGAPRPRDPAAYEAAESDLLAGLAAHAPVDVVGFSLGGRMLLGMAARSPGTFRRLVVMGVGDDVLGPPGDPEPMARAVERGHDPEETDEWRRIFTTLANHPWNDRAALASLLRARRAPVTPADLAEVHCPTLVLLGERDAVGPATRLVAALPAADLVTVRGVDHFGTTADSRVMAAALDFLAGPGS